MCTFSVCPHVNIYLIKTESKVGKESKRDTLPHIYVRVNVGSYD